MCKPGGRILLLQHGKGTWDFINTVLDKGAGGAACCGGNVGGPLVAGCCGSKVGGLSRHCVLCVSLEAAHARRPCLQASCGAATGLQLYCEPCSLWTPPAAPPADDHFVKWGCYWNRDIAKLVRQAGLEVESQSR